MTTLTLPLPITAKKPDIVSAVDTSGGAVVVAETGAGKSTQVPQYFLEAGYEVLVTQPRRLAARMVAQRVADELGEDLGQTVGFRTAYERMDSDQTRCLFVTDGLALVRELMGMPSSKKRVLIIDEVHEWNTNVEVLLAWARLQMVSGIELKVVPMSATLDALALQKYLGDLPIIEVPGRLFPVEEQSSGGRTVEECAASLLRQGRNVLVFQPGVAEINSTIRELERMGVHAEILPLHGKLSAEDQAKCFKHYGRPKCIVATNVAQTSVTIDDIDAVVDSGMEWRKEVLQGVEGLYLRPISYADAKQRAGRAGRTKPGVYIDCCAAHPDDRTEFPVPEIQRTLLEGTVLKLAVAGINIDDLTFFHQPKGSEIREARRTLRALGCMDGLRVTSIGYAVNKLSVGVRSGRMIVEAQKLGVLGDILTIAAVMEQGNTGITARKQKLLWQPFCPEENDADILAQLAIWKAVRAKGENRKWMQQHGILAKAYRQAKERRRLLVRSLQEVLGDVEITSSGDRGAIMRAFCVGMVDQLYYSAGGKNFTGANPPARELANESVVADAKWVVGLPFDLNGVGKYGDPYTIPLLTWVAKVDPLLLMGLAPQLVEKKTGLDPRFDASKGEVYSTTVTRFSGRVISSEEVADPDHPEAPQLRSEVLNRTKWLQWVRPDLVLPDLSDPRIGIPEIRIEVYGHDASTGKALFAYGAIGVNAYGGLVPLWTRDRDEARRRRAEAISELEYIRERARREAERNRLRTAIDAAVRRIYELLREEDRLSRHLVTRLKERASAPSNLDTDERQQWLDATHRLITEAEAAVAALPLETEDDVLDRKLEGLLDRFGPKHRR